MISIALEGQIRGEKVIEFCGDRWEDKTEDETLGPEGKQMEEIGQTKIRSYMCPQV